jgi:hypothetical protein
MNSENSQWKNWGDHPIVVLIAVISSLASIYALFSSSNSNPVITIVINIISIALIVVSSLYIGFIIGWSIHRRRTLNIDTIKLGQYDKGLEHLQKSSHIDLLAINFAGLFNYDIHLRQAIFQHNARVRVLLLDPQSDAFRLYAKKSNEYDIQGLRENSNKAVQSILDIKKEIRQKGNTTGSVSYEFYDSIPFRGIIVTDKVVRYWPYLEHAHPSSSPTYIVARTGGIGDCLVKEFTHLWETAVHKRSQRDWPVEVIISGGQTGVDRAALDWAMTHAIPHGGWCPKGRKAEDGTIAPKYNLQETSSGQYEERTRKNVEDSDGTLIFSRKLELSGGTLETVKCAVQLQKPWLHVVEDDNTEDQQQEILNFILRHTIKRLNVAGPRASGAPGIDVYVTRTLSSVFMLARK